MHVLLHGAQQQKVDGRRSLYRINVSYVTNGHLERPKSSLVYIKAGKEFEVLGWWLSEHWHIFSSQSSSLGDTNNIAIIGIRNGGEQGGHLPPPKNKIPEKFSGKYRTI